MGLDINIDVFSKKFNIKKVSDMNLIAYSNYNEDYRLNDKDYKDYYYSSKEHIFNLLKKSKMIEIQKLDGTAFSIISKRQLKSLKDYINWYVTSIIMNKHWSKTVKDEELQDYSELYLSIERILDEVNFDIFDVILIVDW